MAKTRQALGSEIQATLFGVLDEQTWERLEEALIMADVGARTTAVGRGDARDGGQRGQARGRRGAERAADRAARARPPRWETGASTSAPQPTVIMAVGVNGTGKTTTIGKLAWHLRERARAQRAARRRPTRSGPPPASSSKAGRERAGCEIVTGADGSDPGAVAFEAVAQARARGIDVVIVDTAGRLHTQDDLMGELAKVRRVIARQLEGAPHETLLTLDATTGQNGLRQARAVRRRPRRSAAWC